MASRVVVAFKTGEPDPLGSSLEKTIRRFLSINVASVRTRRAYIINSNIGKRELGLLGERLFADPITEQTVKDSDGTYDWLVEVRYKPGVSNPVGKTATEAARDVLGKKFSAGSTVDTGLQYLLSGVTKEQAETIANKLLSNSVIEAAQVLDHDTVKKEGVPVTEYTLGKNVAVKVEARDMNVDDQKLVEMSRKGVLALSLQEMRIIKDHTQTKEFARSRRSIRMPKEFWNKLTDVELEVLAQTQSEHCKHKIFGGIIKYVDEKGAVETIDSLYGTYIKAPTKRMSKRYKWILSAFKDNAGIVDFGNGLVVADKIETHNAPSALEPYGGAITGILGVNRDVLGAGLGAKPMFNVFGYCFGNPFYGSKVDEGVMHPARIRSGVHRGVIDGGNQSGIPLAEGFEIFDDRFMMRPLVYCGTVGIMPRRVNGRSSEEKKASPGDLVVMVGGRIGKDGIHGATLSSAELDKTSPVQAVQIGDSITQKKMSDFLIEARDEDLYTSITDNGAGGLSSSIGEMAKDSDGCTIDLKKAPLKYKGLAPWEILVSESQERMTVAVNPAKRQKFLDLAKKRGVEATVLGKFEKTGRFHVTYGRTTVAYLDMEFMHDGFPKIEMEGQWKISSNEEPNIAQPDDMNKVMLEMLSRLNVCSKEFKVRQYDHEVKGLSVVKPFVGKERDGPSDATICALEYGEKEGLIFSHGINPAYSDIDTYHMVASAIDEAVRKIIAVGGKMPSADHIMYGLDNFCWNLSSLDSEDGRIKLGQLVRANKALAEYCEAYGVPCISGKDSMKNVWKSSEMVSGKKVEKTVSIPPTLLFSARAKMNDISKAVTMDAKKAGDTVYVVGETYDELGASEYFAYLGESVLRKRIIGNKVPKVDASAAKRTYAHLSAATDRDIVSSIHTPTIGGLGVALVQTAFAGGLGLDVNLSKIPYDGEKRDDYMLFSQSNSRFVVTVAPENEKRFEKVMAGVKFAKVGKVTASKKILIRGIGGKKVVDSDMDSLKSAWKGKLGGV